MLYVYFKHRQKVPWQKKKRLISVQSTKTEKAVALRKSLLNTTCSRIFAPIN